VSIVGRGKQPEPIPDQEIANVRSMLQSGFIVEPHPYLRTGESVIIATGPLRGVEGFLVKHKGKSKMVVSVNLLQRSVAVECDSEAVWSNVQKELIMNGRTSNYLGY
jgi:transcription antitermination factor NusG